MMELEKMIEIYLNDIESYGDSNEHEQARIVLNDFLEYWTDTNDFEIDIRNEMDDSDWNERLS
jgi:hypothetical protein